MMADSRVEAVSGRDYERIVAVFPEIELIQSESLRQKVAGVWLQMWRKADREDLRDFPYWYNLTHRTLVSHVRSVTKAAIGIARSYAEVHSFAIDMDRLIAAAILHDAGKCVEWERKPDGRIVRSEDGKNLPHSYLVMEAARELGISDDIVHIIAAHSPHSMVVTRYLEGAILYFADIADGACVSFAEGRLSPLLHRSLPGWLHQDIFEKE